MTTTNPSAVFPGKPLAKDVQFLQELETIFPKPFNAKIYPDAIGNVEKAKINTNQELEKETLEKLISHAAKWKLSLNLS